MDLDEFLKLKSWNVGYGHSAFDDARCSTDGIWYFRDIITRDVRRFMLQNLVTPLWPNAIEKAE
jgi:hypothetical protein